MGDHCPRSDALLRSTQEPWGPRPLGDRRWRLRALGKAQGLCPWWENKEPHDRNACHSSPISACSPLQAPSPCPPLPGLTCGFSPLPASPGDAFMGIERGTFTTPRLCGWMWALLSITAWHPLSRWPWPIWHHFHFLGSCPKALSGLGVVLGPSPHVGVSELAWMADRCLTRATEIPRTQPTAPTLGE